LLGAIGNPAAFNLISAADSELVRLGLDVGDQAVHAQFALFARFAALFVIDPGLAG
jgi:hypothetical protein